LNYDLDFQSQASCGHDRDAHKFKDQLVEKMEWKQMDGQTNTNLYQKGRE